MIATQLTRIDRDTILSVLGSEMRLQKSCAEDPRARSSERAMSYAKMRQMEELIRKLRMSDVIEFVKPTQPRKVLSLHK